MQKDPSPNTNSQADSGLNNHCSISDLEADYLLVEPKLETCRLLDNSLECGPGTSPKDRLKA
jgi:hypothetical protein